MTIPAFQNLRTGGNGQICGQFPLVGSLPAPRLSSKRVRNSRTDGRRIRILPYTPICARLARTYRLDPVAMDLMSQALFSANTVEDRVSTTKLQLVGVNANGLIAAETCPRPYIGVGHF